MKSYTFFHYLQKTGTGDMGGNLTPSENQDGVMEVVYTFTNLEPCINHLLYVMGVTEIAIGIIFYYVQKSNRPKGEDK